MDTPNTVIGYFLKVEKTNPKQVFLRQPTGEKWEEFSYEEVGRKARKILAELQNRGLQKGDRIAILSSNCAQWIICDIAIMLGGYISVPLYANVNSKTMQDILSLSASSFLFIGKLQPTDWGKIKNDIPSNIPTVTLEGYEKEGILNYDEFIKHNNEPKVAEIFPEDIMTFIYTSGTTGTPKGVIHTHESILNAVKTASVEVFLNSEGNRFVSYLPLSHSAERGLVEVGCIYSCGTISFVESVDTFASNVQAALPTHFFGVPRIWEKFQTKILEKIPQNRLNLLLKIPIISDIIKKKIKESLGLINTKIVISGAAPITPELIRWYQKLDINIQEAYGMSENFNVVSINPQNDIRPGTVGKVFPNQEIIIDPETHEIIQKCNWLMKGYYRQPDLTRETISDGYLHTGDMGELSDDGFLRIIGRVKDIFKTSKGEYITPGPIESRFLELNIVDQSCVMGSLYPQPFILIVLSDIAKLLTKNNIEHKLIKLFEAINDELMEYQKLKKIIIVKEEWTNENELLTPTLKIKRRSLSEKYEQQMNTYYNQDGEIAWEK